MLVQTEVDIDELDVIEELESRGYTVIDRDGDGVWEAIRILQRCGCPGEIIDKLKDWNRQPVITPKKLEEWRKFCGVPA